MKNVLMSRLTEKFQNARIEGSSFRAPRNGYYFIRNVDYKDIKGKGKHPIAAVLWKNNVDEAFIVDVNFHIALSSLNIGTPLDYMNMVYKTFRIYDVALAETGVTCKYEIISQKPKFTTLQALVLGSLGSSSNLNEAYKMWESNLGIDLSASIASEAPDCDVYDAPEDDVYDGFEDDDVYDVPANDDDAYDAPDNDDDTTPEA